MTFRSLSLRPLSDSSIDLTDGSVSATILVFTPGHVELRWAMDLMAAICKHCADYKDFANRSDPRYSESSDQPDGSSFLPSSSPLGWKDYRNSNLVINIYY